MKMAGGKIILTGVKDIDRKLKKLADPKTTNRIVRDAMRKAMTPMKAQAKLNCPKDTGAMSRSYKFKATTNKKGAKLVIRIDGKSVQKLNPKAKGKSAYIYPAAVEFGTDDRLPAAPMRKAFDEGKNKARDVCLETIRAGIMDVAKT
jgi:HK97 gp10 family phage protein